MHQILRRLLFSFCVLLSGVRDCARRSVKSRIPTVPQTKATVLCLLNNQTHNHLTFTVYYCPFFICMFVYLFCSLFLFLRICWNTRPNTPRTYNPEFVQHNRRLFSSMCNYFSNKFYFYSVCVFDSAVSGLRLAEMLNFALQQPSRRRRQFCVC